MILDSYVIWSDMLLLYNKCAIDVCLIFMHCLWIWNKSRKQKEKEKKRKRGANEILFKRKRVNRETEWRRISKKKHFNWAHKHNKKLRYSKDIVEGYGKKKNTACWSIRRLIFHGMFTQAQKKTALHSIKVGHVQCFKAFYISFFFAPWTSST